MIYNYTKCESVIAKIMADLDSSEIRLRISDIREWIFEAVDKIGAPMLYIKKESGVDGIPVLLICDKQVPLPPDLEFLDGAAYSTNPDGPWIPMSTDTAIFKDLKPHKPKFSGGHQPMERKLPTSQHLFYTQNNMRFAEKAVLNTHNNPQYSIKPGWMVINRDNGYVKLAYKALPTDERGYPLIPDLASYLEAVYWYVVMKLSFPKFMNGKLGGSTSKYAAKYAQLSYYYIQQLWNFYRNLAYAECMMPTPDDMLNIKNDWNKLIPDWDGDDTFFKNIGKEEITYNDYYHGY